VGEEEIEQAACDVGYRREDCFREPVHSSKNSGDLCGEAGAAAAGLSGVRVDEVEALAHEGLLVVEDHAAEVDEALGVDEDADRRGVGRGGVEVRLV
jgi:hypothetical protein